MVKKRKLKVLRMRFIDNSKKVCVSVRLDVATVKKLHALKRRTGRSIGFLIAMGVKKLR